MSDLRVGSIVINCYDWQAMYDFWREALGYVPRHPPDPGWVILQDPDGRGVNVSLDGPRGPKTGRNRLHFDLYTTDREREVQRLLALGATLHPRESTPDEDFVVLADPDGNLFCVVQEQP